MDITVASPLDPLTNLRIKLRIVLTAYVRDTDLALFAAGPGVALSGGSKAEWVRALIIMADHTGRLDALVQRLPSATEDWANSRRVADDAR